MIRWFFKSLPFLLSLPETAFSSSSLLHIRQHMDSSSLRVANNPSKCSKLSMEKKRELVYEISKWSHGAPELLQSWSRHEILQILCVEMGKERKYTGLTKLKMIEHLLKIVSGKKSVKLREHEDAADLEPQSSLGSGQKALKRLRETDHPSQQSVPINNSSNDLRDIVYCKNSACRATVSREDAFCKRCSCCICYQYDDNKDPSLWLTCSSEPPFQGDSCGMSCHLECALKHKRSGIAKDVKHGKLDGSFYCVSCRKLNDLLGCWRKQLVMAKDTRRVDILCYRLSLSQKLLKGTQKYQKLYAIVDEAVEKLEAEVGLLTGIPVKMGRGIVNRLSSGPEVQKLCASAVDSLDSMPHDNVSCLLPSPLKQDSGSNFPNMIRFEDVHATSLTVILGLENCPSVENTVNYTLWHRKADDTDYPGEPTCILFVPNTRFVVSDLTPDTEYQFKAVCFNGQTELGMCEVRCSTGSCRGEVPNHVAVERSQSPATNCSTLSNPSSVEDESNNVTPYIHENNNPVDNYSYHNIDKIAPANLSIGAVISSGTAGDKQAGAPVPILSEGHDHRIVSSMTNPDVLKNDNKNSSEDETTKEMRIDNGSDIPTQTGLECVPYVGCSMASLPITPCKLEIVKDGQGRNKKPKSGYKDMENGIGKREDPQNGSTSKKRCAERQDEECAVDGASDRDFEHYVKVIRWLECEGHIEKNFREKFLTWYSLRATSQELRIVKVFADTFHEDPASLAEQLVDTFSESISAKRSSVVPSGFCMKLWH